MKRKHVYPLVILLSLSVLAWSETTAILAQGLNILIPTAFRVGVDFSAAAPPPPPTVVVPAAPGPGYVWEPGYWSLQGGAWVWVPGQWVVPPAPRAVWVPGVWVSVHGGWHWRPGHWR
jgi:hypothetical protein